MSDFHEEFTQLVDRLQKLPAVEALVLGGSRSRGQADSASDYDLYVYCTAIMEPNQRCLAYTGLFSSLELNNRFWETEDDAVFLECSVAVDIIFRDMAWIHGCLRQKLVDFQADIGYSSCIVEGVATGKILFDRTRSFTALQTTAAQPYPRALAESIIRKNQPLLRSSLASFRAQILKAFERGDRISVNHRVAAFLASLFDVIFALNLRLHPGEKRMMDQAIEHCPLVPHELRPLVDRLLSSAASTDLRRGGSEAAFAIDNLCDDLDRLLSTADLLPDAI